jgi:UDPglucose--hexose-1-phosphate uridylyltransferase
VQVFENRGALMGASNPHPHGQVWALTSLPNEPAKEDRQQRAYFEEHSAPLLLDYVGLETSLQRGCGGERALAGGCAVLGGLAV